MAWKSINGKIDLIQTMDGTDMCMYPVMEMLLRYIGIEDYPQERIAREMPNRQMDEAVNFFRKPDLSKRVK